MDFKINNEELNAITGLPHIQQLVYIRGIKPYMDNKTGLVGIKRGISLQSIAEQLYVEPHQGIKSISYSRAHIRRALANLEKIGLIDLQSHHLKLILKCNLATLHYSVQNKVVTNPSQQVVPTLSTQVDEFNKNLSVSNQKPNIAKTAKADTPLKDNNYIYLLFEKFWQSYPQKNSKPQALQVFIDINPTDELFNQMMQALDNQIIHHETKIRNGLWTPPWKFPVNWLLQQSWSDELDNIQENTHAKYKQNNGSHRAKDLFWIPEDEEQEQNDNIIQFKR